MHRRTLLASAAWLGFSRGAPAAYGPVVLELFTSQGCSDCPPADALLGQLAQRPGVVALAWHVDYWDRLGWRDPYASRLSTDRQRAYAARLGSEVFTPALVVNGTSMMVGSDRPGIERAIAHAPSLPVPLVATETGVHVGQASGRVMAVLAVYLPMAETRVGAGENGGRQLREFRLVREARVPGAVGRRAAGPCGTAGAGRPRPGRAVAGRCIAGGRRRRYGARSITLAPPLPTSPKYRRPPMRPVSYPRQHKSAIRSDAALSP